LVSKLTETEAVIKRILPYLRRRGYEPEVDLDFETALKTTERYSMGLLRYSGDAWQGTAVLP
jgi:type I restriction enzyme M protein